MGMAELLRHPFATSKLYLLSISLHLLVLLLGLSTNAVSQSTVSYLPGFEGPLPFYLETGYVSVDEPADVQLFYYFLKSEGNPAADPLIFWFTGGPGCSGLSALFFEIGPLQINIAKYDGSLPTLGLKSYSWTNVSNIIFLDSPVGAGFSYSRSLQGSYSSDTKSAQQACTFITKWLINHPEFLSNPLYVGGDSYSGMIVPIIVQHISDGIEAGNKPVLNLKTLEATQPFSLLRSLSSTTIQHIGLAVFVTLLHFPSSLGRGQSTMTLFTRLSEVDATKKNWSIQVCIVRSYEITSRDNPPETYSLEYVLQDRQGDRIHATARLGLIQKFKSMLTVGKLYSIRSFVVASNRMMFKASEHKYRIYLQDYTQVFEFSDQTFPKNIYRFKPFEEISQLTEAEETHLFDVIGEVVAKDNLQSKTIWGKETNLMDFVIQDTQKNQLQCTLWGEQACQLNTYVESANGDPIIITLQFCRARKYNGLMKICNTFDITHLLINNGDIAEVVEFKKKLMIDKEGSQRISILPSSTIYTQNDELSSGKITLKTIDQLIENEELGNFWVLATIVTVETDREWYYLSCKEKDCAKKINPVGKRFYCARCNKYNTTGIERFKIQLRVIDDSGNAAFLLWDREAVKLLQKSATELKQKISEIGNDRGIPEEFEKLEEKELLFRVQVRDENIRKKSEVFSVTKCVVDSNIISKYKGIESQQGMEQYSQGGNLPLEEHKGSSCNEEITTPTKTPYEMSRVIDVDDENANKRYRTGDCSTSVNKKSRTLIKKEKD